MFAVLALYFVTFKHLYPKLSPIEMREEFYGTLSGASAGALWKAHCFVFFVFVFFLFLLFYNGISVFV